MRAAAAGGDHGDDRKGAGKMFTGAVVAAAAAATLSLGAVGTSHAGRACQIMLPDIARHVIECRYTQERGVQNEWSWMTWRATSAI